MKSTDDIWKDITTLSSPATNHFFAPTLRQPVTTTHPPPPSTTTMLTLLTTTNSDHDQQPSKRHKPNLLPPPQQKQHHHQLQQGCSTPVTTSPEYSEKFRRLMKNRESASRSRARKQARADELEHEVRRLAKENAKLKKQQKEASLSNDPKEFSLHRTKSAPF